MNRFLKAMQLIKEGGYKEVRQKTVYNLWERGMLIEKVKNDKRFYVSDDTARRICQNQPKRYDVCKIRIGEIQREWKGKLYLLTEVSPYAYITQGDTKRYVRYVKKHYDNKNISCEAIDEIVQKRITSVNHTIASIKRDGYDIYKGIVIIDDRNVVLDGQHRCCTLLSLFGCECEITVLRIYYN